MSRNQLFRTTRALAVALVLTGSAQAQTLDEAVDVRQKANGEGTESQKRIDVLSDKTDELLSEYRSTLKQIEALRVYNRQMEELIASQQVEMASLNGQIDRVELVGRQVSPLMLEMVREIEAFVELDVPFLPEERSRRIANLHELVARADVTNAEKYRRILEAYQIENDYGRTIEAYSDTLDEGGASRGVDFLRFGRIALVYQTRDGEESGVWNAENNSWDVLDSNYNSSIRDGLRIAKKQAAPDLIRLPLPAAKAGGSL